MRVGALPQYPSNALNYNLTWSTDGVINEYCEPCEAIVDGQLSEVPALEEREEFSLDGVTYEAFNTSGGLGTLCETLKGKVRTLNYRTIRYPGHAAIMKALLNDLRLRDRRDVLKDIFENALPSTHAGRGHRLRHRHRPRTAAWCRKPTPTRSTAPASPAACAAPSRSRPPPASAPCSTCWPTANCRSRLRAPGRRAARRLPRQPLRPRLRDGESRRRLIATGSCDSAVDEVVGAHARPMQPQGVWAFFRPCAAAPRHRRVGFSGDPNIVARATLHAWLPIGHNVP